MSEPTTPGAQVLAEAEKIMEQAQVFASAWSLVGGRFDSGNAFDEARQAKDELRQMVLEIVAPPQPDRALMQQALDAIDALKDMHRYFSKWPSFVPAPQYMDQACAAVETMNDVVAALSATKESAHGK